MLRLGAVLLVAGLIAVACGGGGGGGGGDTRHLPGSAKEAAEQFLSLWKQKDYDAMYGLVSQAAQAKTDRQKFTDRYAAITDEARIQDFDYELKPASSAAASTASSAAQTTFPFAITFHTSFFGDIQETNAVPIVREEVTVPATEGAKAETHKEWRVDWSPSLFFKELDDRSLVHFFTRVPHRGSILDRNGRPLAVDAQVEVVGIVPDRVKDKEGVIATLTAALGMPESQVRAQVETTLPSYYFIPVKTLPYGTPPEQVQKFREMVDLGVVVREDTRRVYPGGNSAAHILGYITEVSEDQLKTLAAEGFGPGDKIGAAGLEGQLEDTLRGERGALLATVTPEGTIAQTIAEKKAIGGKDVQLAIDAEVQKKAEAELGERVGSIVVMDPHDNSVLALASFPRFDPNAFIDGLSTDQFNALANDQRQPFLNRPLLATYPPGSTFKAVTMAAALEQGGYTTGSTIHCSPTWNGLGDQFVKKNWETVDRGYLTPAEGLGASCDPVFYEMAKTLDEKDPNLLPTVTSQFGFGQATGIGMKEADGVVASPDWKKTHIGEDWFTGDAVNMGIGQGFMLATPLQIANAYSAISSSGVLRKPLLIKKISDPSGAAVQEKQAETINPLPASADTLAAIREGLTIVTQSPAGTSYAAWLGSSVDAAGKSGTAEDLAYGANHIFFVAYANRGDPAIVALAALETGESGSREAAPMVRHILEAYLGGQLNPPPPSG